MKKRYGIDVADFERILAEQNYCCAICATPDLQDSRGFRPHIDHCHTTGKVRGILCRPRNKGIGQLKDDPAIIYRAFAYLLKNRE